LSLVSSCTYFGYALKVGKILWKTNRFGMKNSKAQIWSILSGAEEKVLNSRWKASYILNNSPSRLVII
jgi:hypothetical protein